MDKISIIRCNDYDHTQVREAMNSLLEPLGGIGAFVRPGERVLLKPNLLAAKAPEAAVTTHPAVVKAVAEMLRDAGCRVMIGDSPGIGGFRKVADKSGISQAALESGAELVDFDETIEVKGEGTFRRIAIARAYWEADKIINLPKLKTHEMMTMTCAVKNLFGAVVGAEKPAWHLKAGTSREQFARLLLEIYLLKMPVLNIVDGIVAMEGNGPGSGDPVRLGALIAGVNPVAVDVVAGRLAGIPAELLCVEREAARMGLAGTADGRDRDCRRFPRRLRREAVRAPQRPGRPIRPANVHKKRPPAAPDVISRVGCPPLRTVWHLPGRLSAGSHTNNKQLPDGQPWELHSLLVLP